MMKINCKYPTIIRNPEFNKLISTGYTQIYYDNNLLVELTKQQVIDALSDLYVKIEEIQINQGYTLNNPENNSFDLPLTVTNVYTYSQTPTGHVVKKYSEDFLKYVKPYRDLYHRQYSITYTDSYKFVFVNVETGDIQPVFNLVDCCHCLLCHKKKRSRLSSRVMLESTKYEQPPLFITLTYAQKNYPENCYDVALHTQELQKFNKRLRKSLEPYSSHYKYFAVSEYGSLRGRLHYHLLLFGITDSRLFELVKNDYMEYDNEFLEETYLITKLIYKAWNRGIINVQLAQDCTGQYVSKYVGKQRAGKPTKNLKSQLLGNHVFTAQKIEEIRQNTSLNSFLILIDNKVQEIPLHSWIQTKIYPSLARQMDREFRTALLSAYSNMRYYNLEETQLYKKFHEKYSGFVKLLGFDDYSLNSCNAKITVEMYNAIVHNINKVNTYDYDIQQISRINDLRNEHILLTNVIEYDVDYNNYIENLRINLQNQNERDNQ